MLNVLELTKTLIEIPSVSGDERQVAEYTATLLDQLGFQVILQEAEFDRPNVYAWLGEPAVVLSTHTDTVPPFFGWSEDEEFVYGRGACDAKGIMAAMIVAAQQLQAQGIKGFGLLFVVGEERGSIGARRANDIPNVSRFLINGEPTESTLATGSKGALRFKLKTRGVAGHSAYPELGESAIHNLLDILQRLRQTAWPTCSRLGATTLNIGELQGGVAPNVIAPQAEAHLIFRVVTSIAHLKQHLESVVCQQAAIEYLFECEPVITEVIEGFPNSIAAFTTDIPLLTNWGKPLLFGPGSIHDAHTATERIRKSELLAAPARYVELVKKLIPEVVSESQNVNGFKPEFVQFD